MREEKEEERIPEYDLQEGVIRLLKGEKGAKKRARRAGGDRLSALKQAAEMACWAIADLFADEKQFCRHAYQDKTTGAIMETTLSMRNVKQMRETIQAIRDLAETVRSLYGLLSPEAEREMEMQLKKFQLEEKKLSAAAEEGRGDTGVVLLPVPEDVKDG